MQEFQERLAQLQASCQEEQASRACLERDISSLRGDFDLRVSVLQHLLRKEAGVEAVQPSQVPSAAGTGFALTSVAATAAF